MYNIYVYIFIDNPVCTIFIIKECSILVLQHM